MPKNKIIAVFGNTGSGKTTTAIMLAYRLSLKGKNVVVISIDRNTPQMQCILPTSDINTNNSLGNILMNEVTEQILVPKIKLHHQSERIGFLGFQSGEKEIQYPAMFNIDKYKTMLNILYNLTDYIIIDASSNPITNTLTLSSLELADKVITILSADHNSKEWLSPTYEMIKDNKFKADSHIKVLSNYTPYHPVDILISTLNISYSLPFSSDILTSRLSGDILVKHKSNTGYTYLKTLDTLVEEVIFSG